MTAQAQVSIITVSYNTGPVLWRMIASALASTVPIELIVVDNGNPPDAAKKLADMAGAEPRLKLISGHGNVGFAKGCNLGAGAATADFLLFLNPDGLLPPDAIARLLDHAKKLERPFMLGARLLDGDGKDQRGCRRALLTPVSALVEAFGLWACFPKMRLNLHDEPLPKTVSPMPAISGAFMFLAAEDFHEINGFDESYFLHVEDLDFCLRFRRAGGEIYFVPDIAVTHIGGTSSANVEFLETQKAKGFIRYFHNNFGHVYPQPLLWLLDAAIMARLGVKLLIARANRSLNPSVKPTTRKSP